MTVSLSVSFAISTTQHYRPLHVSRALYSSREPVQRTLYPSPGRCRRGTWRAPEVVPVLFVMAARAGLFPAIQDVGTRRASELHAASRCEAVLPVPVLVIN